MHPQSEAVITILFMKNNVNTESQTKNDLTDEGAHSEVGVINHHQMLELLGTSKILNTCIKL